MRRLSRNHGLPWFRARESARLAGSRLRARGRHDREQPMETFPARPGHPSVRTGVIEAHRTRRGNRLGTHRRCAAGVPTSPSRSTCSCSTATTARRQRWASPSEARRPGGAVGPARGVRPAHRHRRLPARRPTRPGSRPPPSSSSPSPAGDVTIAVRGRGRRRRRPDKQLPDPPPVCRWTWLHRDGAEAGTTTWLVEAPSAALPWPDGNVYVWGGGGGPFGVDHGAQVRSPASAASTREAVSLTGYWRHASHGADPVDDED